MSAITQESLNQIEELLNIGIALSAEKDHNRLLDMIVTEARRVTNADAGTLFLRAEDNLEFKIIHNESLDIFQGSQGENVNLPPVPIKEENISGAAVIKATSINIPDVYDNATYDFKGPRKYDAITGYRTKSMLVIPMENYQGEIIGVLQLINARNSQGQVIPFAPYLEKVVLSIASQAAVSLTNMQYLAEIDALFHSVVEVVTEAIDERSPYNVNHTRHVADMAVDFAHYLNALSDGPFAEIHWDEEHIGRLRMAALFHDLGKVAIPLEIMDKPTRLGDHLEFVLLRLDLISEQLKRKALAGSAVDEQLDLVKQAKKLVLTANDPKTFIDDPILAELTNLTKQTYTSSSSKEEPWITPEEFTSLSIRKGTLTDKERGKMASHVAVTERMLSKIAFSKRNKDVPQWAISHHELLDGSGYHRNLTANQLPLETRILTILDIYDALTATDRPYKRPMPKEKALSILSSMAKEGKLDKDLVTAFANSQS